MTESKHTPGPWELHPLMAHDGKEVREATGKGRLVGIGLGPDADSQEANARLIASAPEMLELLRRYVQVCEDQKLTGELKDDACAILAKIEVDPA